MVDRLEQDFGGELAVIRVDAGASAAAPVVRSLRVRGHPTLVLLDVSGKEVARFLGPPSQDQVREAILGQVGSP